ncbi:MAG: HIT domain-containing protein [Pseudomonadota bacterium]|uniref:Histidine triad domain protein n=1 Tax=Methylophaga thalassica TaxID=40223 RepID=A0ABQ5TVJ4_9GAMM|nr:HIT domain-containing protein [Methylophaga thalassica]MEC9411959.1 HIT domain-containing protein [Pseudomonadota bacterium]GLP99456.1 histidine triad domain protein [Methylophaga thalassica]
MYELHPQLKQDTIRIGEFELCEVLLMNDMRYPWLILVPKRENKAEIYQLTEQEQQRLLIESSFVSKAMSGLFSAAKMNIAALGNMVEQLHIHHIARFKTDATWPKPVWGIGQAEPYSEIAKKAMLSQLTQALGDYLF